VVIHDGHVDGAPTGLGTDQLDLPLDLQCRRPRPAVPATMTLWAYKILCCAAFSTLEWRHNPTLELHGPTCPENLLRGELEKITRVLRLS